MNLLRIESKKSCGFRKKASGEDAKRAIQACADAWPSKIVARSKIAEFTGGVITAGSLANLDSQGLGVPGSFLIGRQTCYPVENVVAWLIERLKD